MLNTAAFVDEFAKLEGVLPFSWQCRLFGRFLEGDLPAALDLPTGLGKTSIMAVWYLALKAGAAVPRRLVYVVDRRVVVDQATTVADKIKENADDATLQLSTLRGQHVDKKGWLKDPAAPAIIVGTVDMIGSRLLFSGYGVSPKMRPYYAGLLGADALVVLDEAHLVPPFEMLLEAIETSADTLGPHTEDARNIIPAFKLLSLSATGRERQGKVFRLCDEDFNDAVVRQRLDAAKRIKLEAPHAASDLTVAMAKLAWERGHGGRRVIVFCNSRKTAQKVHDELKEELKKNSKEIYGGPMAVFTDALELVVGARRVHEREQLTNSRVFRRFSPKAQDGCAKADSVPAFLVCTSAGEVGVDIDADHMVCDLVPWERMVQRLGRVNRLGKFSEGSLVNVFPALSEKDNEAEITADEARLATWGRPFESELWPVEGDGRKDASPGMLRRLRQNEFFKTLADAATTPMPLRPALTRPLVDAWSMTSLEKHTGRPEIDPWLRGWVETKPQTSVVWRKYLPVRPDGTPVSKKEVDDFFEAAPPQTSEKLETETWRVVEWLMARVKRLKEKLTKDRTESDGDAEAADLLPLKDDSVVAFALAQDGTRRGSYSLRDLDSDRKRGGRLESDFSGAILSGAILIVDIRIAGLADGLLNHGEDELPPTMDSDADWSRKSGLRVRKGTTLEVSADSADWRFEDDFAAAKTEDGEATEWLVIERLKDSSSSEGGRAISNPQSLSGHQACAADKARALAEALGLRPDLTHALQIAARLHDEGKRAWRWQRAFNAPRGDAVYAKTKGPINQALLDGYRHEFGSLTAVEKDAAFQELSGDLQDLVLHMVAAHHGGARPVISTRACDDAPPSALAARARDVALRFARLQKIWGPWGLAWWESLLRAADQQASRENDERRDISPKGASEEAA